MNAPLRVAVTPGPFTPGVSASWRSMTLADPTADGVVLGEVTPVADADVALFPYEIASVVRTPADLDALRSVVSANARAGLRTVVCLDHDHCRPVSVGQPDAIVLRTSMIASMDYVGEHAMPPRVEDPWAGGPAQTRPWNPVPRVGFMGRVDAAQTRLLAAYDPAEPVPAGFSRSEGAPEEMFPLPVDLGGLLRRRAIAGLSPSTRVESSIVVRDRFFGHYDAADRRAMRSEYGAHLADSDYVLCVRGYGNYSIRLFETLAMGRVPVVLESELVLPCADVVDWDAIAVRVPLADIDRIDAAVAAAHADGPEAFEGRQRAARQAWLRWLCVDGFARYVADVIVRADRG